jgi:hypothetical protein
VEKFSVTSLFADKPLRKLYGFGRFQIVQPSLLLFRVLKRAPVFGPQLFANGGVTAERPVCGFDKDRSSTEPGEPAGHKWKQDHLPEIDDPDACQRSLTALDAVASRVGNGVRRLTI